MSAIKLGRSLIWWIITVAFDVIILIGNLWQAGAARHGGDALGSPSIPRPLSSRCGSQAAIGSAHTQAKSSSICLLAKQVGGVSQTGSLNTLTSQQKRCTLPRSGPPQQQPVSPPRCHQARALQPRPRHVGSRVNAPGGGDGHSTWEALAEAAIPTSAWTSRTFVFTSGTCRLALS